ncbi:prepilin-type N-terminal cleavage/methylation domain-containing protein [Desulfohalotomaculum tongense]|uniref:prepilin-type N-terminal cleavage/methylation domain-containing protein n=1 Tax=Desulforadius tongensis TaxID=1216062 RepID=UPI001957A706|nr:prepilin-type N-terminal cleavage/methylation domain-containing protein [Desulforadius tongensis]MBM7854069.1 prepilin-type N-terminal cleavage/methylation domain-containing protein [Desulforadius tongensis]
MLQMFDYRNKSRRGFTLIEVLISLTILLIVALALVPLFSFVARSTQANRARLVAMELAAGRMEEIRQADYITQIGEVGGTPVGIFPSTETRTIGGIEYTINTEIVWKDDPSDGTGDGDVVPFDYKGIRVTVSAPGVFNGKVTQYADFNSLAAKEEGESIIPVLKVRVNRGWVDTPGVTVPVEGVRTTLLTGPGAPRSQFTGANGESIYDINLSGSDYGTVTVKVTPPLGMIVRPDMAGGQSVAVAKGTTSTAVFEVERPCALEFYSDSTGRMILKQPYGGDITQEVQEGNNKVENLWPVGDGAEGTYKLTIIDEAYVQNFDGPGSYTVEKEIGWGGNPSWEFGEPTTGPRGAHTGSGVWATNLNGNYKPGERSCLVSPEIDLRGFAGADFKLSWWQWLQTEEGYDYVYVDVNKNGGDENDWVTVYKESGDVDLKWAEKEITLDSSYAVKNFKVRFRFQSDGSIQFPGWYIDDIAIYREREHDWDGKFKAPGTTVDPFNVTE